MFLAALRAVTEHMGDCARGGVGFVQGCGVTNSVRPFSFRFCNTSVHSGLQPCLKPKGISLHGPLRPLWCGVLPEVQIRGSPDHRQVLKCQIPRTDGLHVDGYEKENY